MCLRAVALRRSPTNEFLCFALAHSRLATCRSVAAAKSSGLIGVSQSILVDPFSSLHHQCVAWILSG